MKHKYVLVVILTLITILGFTVRIYKLGEIPNSLNVDEVSIGYNAYSILKTGKDEFGIKFPINFRSLGDYKPPLYIYLTSISEYIFGLNEFAVRFPSFLFGTLLIPLIYLLIIELSKDEKMAIFGSFLLSISPWGIWFSRIASEAVVALFLMMLGLLIFLKSKGNILLLTGSAFVLSLSIYTYHAEKLFVPLFFIYLCFLYRNKYNKKDLFLFLSVIFLLSLPMFYETLFGVGATRAGMTSIMNDRDFLRGIYINDVNTGNLLLNSLSNKYLLIFFFWIRKYLAYFSPSFLFYKSLNMTEVFPGLGVLNMFEIPLVIGGVYLLFKEKREYIYIIISWILLGILPASLTMNEQHTIRAMIILPTLVFISSLGFSFLVSAYRKLKYKILKTIIGFSFSVFAVWCFAYSFLMFRVHSQYQTGENFMQGVKESVLYALNNKDKYKEIVFDPHRGIKAPNIVNVPHLYILFYSAYDPLKYQTMSKKEGEGYLAFDKYVIRDVFWNKDKYNKDTLYIISPWNILEEKMKDGEILKKIYIGHNDLVLIVVAPK